MKYSLKWENRYLSNDAENIDELIACYMTATRELKYMRKLIRKKKLEADFSKAHKDLIMFYSDDDGVAEEYAMDGFGAPIEED